MKYLMCLIGFLPVTGFSQLYIGGNDPYDLAANVLSAGTATISNAEYSGSPDAICYFQADLTNMPFSSGILLTTGTKWSNNIGPHGPNNEPGAGVDNKYPGSSKLAALSPGSQTYNAATLEFDIVPFGNSITIRYMFGSDEYPEYVGTDYKDIAAIFINGPEFPSTGRNFAVLPNLSIVGVNTVNNGNVNASPPVPATNSNYFVYNGDGTSFPYNNSDQYLQYDGLTVPMTAIQEVTPGVSYHITIVIADFGDGIFDSGLFLEAGSLTASVNEQEASLVSIFPNPAKDNLTIRLEPGSLVESYTLTDACGKILLSNEISSEATISLADYGSGIYFVNLLSSIGTIVKKVQKI